MWEIARAGRLPNCGELFSRSTCFFTPLFDHVQLYTTFCWATNAIYSDSMADYSPSQCLAKSAFNQEIIIITILIRHYDY